MTAPDRIWAWTSGQAAGIFDTSFHETPGSATEYVRADLAAIPAQVRKKFPVLGSSGASVDLQLVEDHGEQAKKNHYQTIMRLAERGGLSWAELFAVLHNRPFQKIDTNEAMIACRALEARYLAALEPQPDPRDEHFDDYAVRSFAKMMAAKMAASRAKGRGGWSDPKQCSVEYLRRLLYTHLDKGDPVDVANICMMLRHYEASTAHEYESSAMAAACASRDEVIARLVGALKDAANSLDDYSPFTGNTIETSASKRARAAIAAAKAVQK